MDKETKHLLKWQMEWLIRFFRTWYHLFNRKAYHDWKESKHIKNDYSPFNESEEVTGQYHA